MAASAYVHTFFPMDSNNTASPVIDNITLPQIESPIIINNQSTSDYYLITTENY